MTFTLHYKSRPVNHNKRASIWSSDTHDVLEESSDYCYSKLI